MSFFIELFCVVTLQYQILVRIAIAYFIIEKKKAAPQPWQAIAQRFGSTGICLTTIYICIKSNIFMIITLETRTADSVRTYFEKANRPEIKQVLPQKAKTVEEALADYEETLLPNATSFGQTVYVDGKYVGDVWCYCIDMDDEPNCMLSFCIFELEYWSKGIATSAVNMFIKNVCERYNVKTIGAFTFAHNNASIRVLEKNGFVVIEEFEEDGVLSKYLQYEC